MRFLIPVLVILWVIPQLSFSQISPKRCKWVKVGSPIVLDTLSILPSSVFVSSPADSSLRAKYDINTNLLSFENSGASDSALICYTVLPFNLSQKYFKRDRAIYDTNRFFVEDFKYSQQAIINDGKDLLNTPGIEKNGSLVRGINFGNNQNLSNTSALNLQMNGKITDEIGIAAVISDQNIPFQPEGNTQQIQEFDKVYIQLFTDKSRLTAGDLVMTNQPGHFLKFSRNVQGGMFEGKYVKDSTTQSFTSVGAAVSKGKFASTQVQPLEGVQGPYRLRGPNNERFIIVLSNSERVFVDGRPLKRGFDFDYVIDYNQSEITFTNNVLITRFSIIRIDFEYSEKNYGRVNLNASHHQKINNVEVYGNFFLQRDNPNNPLFFTLDNDQKNYLSDIGDDNSRAIISGVDSINFQENRIMYRKLDSAGTDIYEYSIDPQLATYDVVFTDVGFGNGEYNQVRTTANGKVFKFVGKSNGQFLPVRVIPLPKKNQMFSFGGSYNLSPTEKIYSEIAISENDENLYSRLNEEDDQGKAVKAGFISSGKLIPGSKTIKWTGSADFEFNEKTFREIDRFRDINFERDWSADPAVNAYNRILNISGGIYKNNQNSLIYRLSRRIKGQEVNGWQHSYSAAKSMNQFNFISNGFWMNNRKPELFSDWKRFDLNASWVGKSFSPGIIYSFDKNIVLDNDKHIRSSAMYFDEIKAYLKTSDTAAIKYHLDYAYRVDQDTLNGKMTPSTRARTFNSGFGTIIQKKSSD